MPSHLIGKKNIIIAVPHGIKERGAPSFEITQKGKQQEARILDKSQVFLYERPAKSGWRKIEDKFSLPVEEEGLRDQPSGRFFLLFCCAPHVGLLGRGLSCLVDYFRRDVNAVGQPSLRRGVLAAVPEWAEKNLKEFAERAIRELAKVDFISKGHKEFIREQLEKLKAA